MCAPGGRSFLNVKSHIKGVLRFSRFIRVDLGAEGVFVALRTHKEASERSFRKHERTILCRSSKNHQYQRIAADSTFSYDAPFLRALSAQRTAFAFLSTLPLVRLRAGAWSSPINPHLLVQTQTPLEILETGFIKVKAQVLNTNRMLSIRQIVMCLYSVCSGRRSLFIRTPSLRKEAPVHRRWHCQKHAARKSNVQRK